MYRIQGADHKEYGPITADQLRQWIAERRLNHHSLACLDTDGVWKPLGQFAEFAADLAAAGAPVPGIPAAPAGPAGPTGFGTPATPGGWGDGGRAEAERKVQGPAIGLIILGAMGLLFGLFGLVSHFAGFNRNPQLPPGLDDQTRQMIQMWVDIGEKYGAILNLVSMGFAVVILLGGLKLRRLEGYGLVLAASILALLPCTNACCCLGLPMGIWALVASSKPEVKSHFR